MTDTQPALLVVGGLHIDEVATLQGDLVEQASNPVCWQRYVGGVASNAARVAHAHYSAAGCGSTSLHAALGNDEPSHTLLAAMHSEGVKVIPQRFDDHPTGRYSAIITNSGELLMGFADVQLAEKLSPSTIVSAVNTKQPTALLLDANLSSDCLSSILQATSETSINTAAMTVSPVKALKLLPFAKHINLLFCNRREALALAVASGLMKNNTSANQATILQLAQVLNDAGFEEFVLTDGRAGVLTGRGGLFTTHDAPLVPVSRNVNGAGDALSGATFAALTLGVDLDEAVVKYGCRKAADVITGKWLPLEI